MASFHDTASFAWQRGHRGHDLTLNDEFCSVCSKKKKIQSKKKKRLLNNNKR